MSTENVQKPVSNPTVPLGFLPTEIDNQVNDFITGFEAEVRAEELAEPAVEGQVVGEGSPPVELAAASADGTPVPPVTTETVVTKPEPVSEVVAREVALARREEVLSVKERTISALEDKVKALEARQMPEDISQALRFQPGQTLRAMGLDPDAFVRVYLAEKMGDKAPPELRATIENNTRDREVSALRSELQNYQRAQATQAYNAKIEAGAREHVTKLGDNASTPTVAKVAKANPTRVTSEI